MAELLQLVQAVASAPLQPSSSLLPNRSSPRKSQAPSRPPAANKLTTARGDVWSAAIPDQETPPLGAETYRGSRASSPAARQTPSSTLPNPSQTIPHNTCRYPPSSSHPPADAVA